MPEGKMTGTMRRLLARAALAALLAACAGAPLSSVAQAAQGTPAFAVQGAQAATDTGAKKDAAAPVFVARLRRGDCAALLRGGRGGRRAC